MQPQRDADGRSTWLRAAATCAATAVLIMGTLPAAAAPTDEEAVPSQAEVERARERAAQAKRSVEEIKADLAAAAAELARLRDEAQAAFDAYYAAVERLEEARATADEAKRVADRYSRRVENKRQDIAALVVGTYQGGASFGQVSAYLMSEDADRLLARVSTYRSASDSVSAQMDAFSAEHAIAEVFKQEARDALAKARDAAAEAERVRQQAESAVAAQQAAVAGIQERRDALIAELAEAENISVELARQRQDALEQIAAERAAAKRREEARREAERQARIAAQRKHVHDHPDEAEHGDEPKAAPRPQPRPEPEPASKPAPEPAPEPEPAPVPKPAPAPKPAPKPALKPEPKPKPKPAPRPDVVLPLSPSAYYYNQDNFGNCASYWSNCHTGNDFSTSCGTDVLAATSGIVDIRYDQPWSGPWLVQVISNSGTVTWYSHMQDVDVYDGQWVMAGQQIGDVGTEGNSTGCHLHFEVRPGGGSPIDPVDWLRSHGVYV